MEKLKWLENYDLNNQMEGFILLSLEMKKMDFLINTKKVYKMVENIFKKQKL
jgi:hypothetical protein